MRRHLKISFGALVTAFSVFAWSGCTKDDPVEEPPAQPVLTITAEGDVTVAPEGGSFTVPFSLESEWQDGELDASCSETWVEVSGTVSSGTVTLTAEPNETGAQRTAVLTLTYTFGEGETVSDEVNLVQDQTVPEVTYDYDVTATFFEGYYYGDTMGNNGEYNFFATLAESLSGDGYLSYPYYQFDIFCEAPEDEANPQPYTGTYPLGEPYATDVMTITPDFTRIVMEDGTDVPVTEGTLVITSDAAGYTYEATLVDAKGNTHHVVYTGPCDYIDETGSDFSYDVLETDLDFEAGVALASYMASAGNLMDVSIQMTDMAVDADGYVTPPGTILSLDAYMPFDEEGNIAVGTYTVSADGSGLTLYPGEMLDLFGLALPQGTYAEYYDETGYPYYGMITSGTMTVTGENGNYTIECDLVTAEGRSVKCSYTGALTVSDIPGPISTLTGDYTVDLSNAAGSAVYYGDYYSTGSNWMFTLLPADGITGDGLQVDLVTSSQNFADGIASGVYKAAAGAFPEEGEYLPGYADGNSLGGTMYVGGFDADGYVSEFAPAMSGDLAVTNNGDGTYAISFSFTDDRGNVVDGEWEGAMAVEDYSVMGGYSALSASGKTSGKEAMRSASPARQVSVSDTRAALKVKPLLASGRLARTR